MNRIKIAVMKPQAALSTFAETWRPVEAGEEAVPRLAFGSLRELFSAITEKRLELLRYVAAHEGLNVRQLAQRELDEITRMFIPTLRNSLNLGCWKKMIRGS